MGTLGPYLRDAREARGIDLRDAAQQTRISIHYLKALEAEDFTRLPGEVFVKGFLKSYGKFLRLDESELIKKYEELSSPAPATAADKEPPAAVNEQKASQGVSVEPFLWGAGIVIILIIFLVTAKPRRHEQNAPHEAVPAPAVQPIPTPLDAAPKTDKLYLEIVALEDTWLLVRIDTGPQKKAVLKKGDTLVWSADERFLLSYGKAGALKLQLNGRELIVNEPGSAVVRDLSITAAGIVSKKVQPEQAGPARPKRRPAQAQPPVTPAPGPQRAPETSPPAQQTKAPGQSVPLKAPAQAPSQ